MCEGKGRRVRGYVSEELGEGHRSEGLSKGCSSKGTNERKSGIVMDVREADGRKI